VKLLLPPPARHFTAASGQPQDQYQRHKSSARLGLAARQTAVASIVFLAAGPTCVAQVTAIRLRVPPNRGHGIRGRIHPGAGPCRVPHLRSIRPCQLAIPVAVRLRIRSGVCRGLGVAARRNAIGRVGQSDRLNIEEEQTVESTGAAVDLAASPGVGDSVGVQGDHATVGLRVHHFHRCVSSTVSPRVSHDWKGNADPIRCRPASFGLIGA